MMEGEKIAVVGAGLSGSLLAIRLAQRGYDVHVFEKRPDPRANLLDAGRSINLALSDRGLKALAMVGLEAEVDALLIPMEGRMVHPKGEPARFSRYSGRSGEHINSISRPGLNALLLDKAETYPNVTLYFDAPCTRIDIEEGVVELKNQRNGVPFVFQASTIIGSDGAGSAVRRSMMAQSNELRFDYSQNFLPHGYKELSILPKGNGGWALESNALHIWPRGGYMVIALPNLDGSFTVTMFHPFEGKNGFDELTDPAKVEAFFAAEYPDLLGLMPHLREEFFANPTSSLGTIRCYPWQANGKVLLIGDAAHAIVPFYGQGMNAAFEDVRLLDDFLEKNNSDWTTTFEGFQQMRKKDADAIADLALDNFIEMRDKVADPLFVKKRSLEMALEAQYPEYYSKYSLVTFKEDLPYSEAMARGRRQDAILLDYCARTAEPKPEEALRLVENELKIG
jgi:kynurenine 3-monooxygenase